MTILTSCTGTYNEQVPSINRPGAVNIIGYTTGNPGQSYKDNQVTITFSRGLSVSPLPVGHSDAETASVSTASNRVSFYNINIINSDNLDGSEANYVTLAASIYGNDIGFYACSFNGWQDTLLNGATTGYQYYESCYIGGAIDFIWGYSKAYFKGCTIGAKRASSAMTAQSRASSSAIGGYIFDQCLFTTAPDATVDLTNKVYLGRPYSAYALVVIKNSYIDALINPSGWKVWSATDPRTDHVTFAEYNNSGPSNWENNAAARLAFGNATLLTSDTYPLASVMDSTSWIDMTYWNSIVTPQPAAPAPAGNITIGGNSTYNGTVPPQDALIVSQQPIAGKTVYGTIQAALNAAPTSSKMNATIFIYPGTYNEQLIVNKSGSMIFMGYSTSTDDYSQNQVTITQSYGVDTQGGGSDVGMLSLIMQPKYYNMLTRSYRCRNRLRHWQLLLCVQHQLPQRQWHAAKHRFSRLRRQEQQVCLYARLPNLRQPGHPLHQRQHVHVQDLHRRQHRFHLWCGPRLLPQQHYCAKRGWRFYHCSEEGFNFGCWWFCIRSVLCGSCYWR